MIKLGERIKQARIKKGLTQEELARRLGIAYPTLSKYENGHRIPDANLLSHLAKELDCDPGWLLIGDEDYSEKAHDTDFITVPFIEYKYYDDSEKTHSIKIKIDEEIRQEIGNIDNITILKISGDDMAPTLHSGDLVIINKRLREIEPQGGIYAIEILNNLMIKRIQILYPSEILRIISDNRNYPVMDVSPNYVKVYGKVIYVIKKLV
ncbi:XRE family transcriptional regulator [Thermodesulfovibrio yellowstonii]|uniref:XRE family transcriptional regulator n=1 Tax=Thermodesulfovibrio yellowstonii TaxID=28262 RepID=UPI003C7C7A11